MNRGVFVAGSDTGVGKTLVATALLRALAAAGVAAAGMKPVAAGIEPGTTVNADVAALAAADGLVLPCADRNPYAFVSPIAPHLAARDVGVEILIEHIARAFERLGQPDRFVVVEGAGGVAVPLGQRSDMLDIPLRLGLPVLLVVGVRLGCLNHALLSAGVLCSRGLTLAGWVANRLDPHMLRADDNVAALAERLGGAPLVDVAWGSGPVFSRAAIAKLTTAA